MFLWHVCLVLRSWTYFWNNCISRKNVIQTVFSLHTCTDTTSCNLYKQFCLVQDIQNVECVFVRVCVNDGQVTLFLCQKQIKLQAVKLHIKIYEIHVSRNHFADDVSNLTSWFTSCWGRVKRHVEGRILKTGIFTNLGNTICISHFSKTWNFITFYNPVSFICTNFRMNKGLPTKKRILFHSSNSSFLSITQLFTILDHYCNFNKTVEVKMALKKRNCLTVVWSILYLFNKDLTSQKKKQMK